MNREMMGRSRQGEEREPLRREEAAPVGGRRPWDNEGAPPREGNAAPSGRRVGRVVPWFADDDRASGLRRGATGGQPGGDRRGLGPRRAPRSDERIREEVCDRLMDDRHVDATDIEVRVEGGEVTLTGTVDRRDTRRRAEDIAEAVGGVTHVQSNLRYGRTWRGDVGTAGPVRTAGDLGARDREERDRAAPASGGYAPTLADLGEGLGGQHDGGNDGDGGHEVVGTGGTGGEVLRTVAALFDERTDADRAVGRLCDAGIDRAALVVSDRVESKAEVAERPVGRGRLADVRMPEADRHAYAEGVRRGGVLVTAMVTDAAAGEVVRILNGAGAVDLDARMRDWRGEGWRDHREATRTTTAAGPAPAVGGVGADADGGSALGRAELHRAGFDPGDGRPHGTDLAGAPTAYRSGRD